MAISSTNTTTTKQKKTMSSSNTSLCTTLFFVVLFTIPALFLLHTPTTTTFCSVVFKATAISTTTTTTTPPKSNWSGDLLSAEFAWNRLSFDKSSSPREPDKLRIAVFSRKWPAGSAPGGMERHAQTLYSALSRRGHQVHVFTGPDATLSSSYEEGFPVIHPHEGEPGVVVGGGGRWRYNKAWEIFEKEEESKPFDVVHSESVALPHWLARSLPNLVVSWHGIALESLHSLIAQDLATNTSSSVDLPKILNEIRFFRSYAHHVAISDSCGDILRDDYQIPPRRVHVILNGVDETGFSPDPALGKAFRNKFGVPRDGIVVGVAGRLVKDKGHPILHEAFLRLAKANRSDVFLVVVGSGPWESRYRDAGMKNVAVVGSMNPSELRGFYNAIDVFVNPTLRPQGLDLTLMEAMMAGKPVMASRFPSIKGTILVEEEFGFLFSPNTEALLEVLEKAATEGPARLAERGRACQRYAKSMFTAEKMALAYERLFLCIKNRTFCQYYSSS